ncbi:MAG: Fic family protein [Candidatus Thiodiazotropha sp. (ex. Lucinoma kazani)]
MWIWQNKNWPNYLFDASAFSDRVDDFRIKSERLYGRIEALPNNSQTDALVDLMLSEAIKTSAIEGEHLDRESVRSSLLSLIGQESSPLSKDEKAVGAAALMVDVRRHWDQPLSNELLGRWQSTVLSYQRTTLIMRGAYRNAPEPMQIISGRIGKYNVHYEAPPSSRVPDEMDRFIDWYNSTSPINGDDSLPGPIRAGIAHVWFENIHPFDDGNGRVGRAISDHALSQSLGFPTMACLATAIEINKKAYYNELEQIGRGSQDLNHWLNYFTGAVNQAQDIAKQEVDFVLGKTRFYDKFQSQLNVRQAKAVQRVFAEGRKGFVGGLNAKKYQAITKCSRATATRDLTELLEKGVITKLPGGGRSTSYELSAVTPSLPTWMEPG